MILDMENRDNDLEGVLVNGRPLNDVDYQDNLTEQVDEPRSSELELLAEQAEESYIEKGGGGGGKKKRDAFGRGKRDERKTEEAREGMLANATERHEHGEKSPQAEIDSVLRFLAKQDRDNPDMPALTEYLDWLKSNVASSEVRLKEEEFGKWEQMTASVHAGGSGRQTSRNARARTHLITGIRATSEESRQGAPNEKIVMDKLKQRLNSHLKNWRTVLTSGKEKKLNLESLEEKVLGRIAEL